MDETLPGQRTPSFSHNELHVRQHTSPHILNLNIVERTVIGGDASAWQKFSNENLHGTEEPSTYHTKLERLTAGWVAGLMRQR